MTSNYYRNCRSGLERGPDADRLLIDATNGPTPDIPACNGTVIAAPICELECCASRDTQDEVREEEKKTVEPCTECDGIDGKGDKLCCDGELTPIAL